LRILDPTPTQLTDLTVPTDTSLINHQAKWLNYYTRKDMTNECFASHLIELEPIIELAFKPVTSYV